MDKITLEELQRQEIDSLRVSLKSVIDGIRRRDVEIKRLTKLNEELKSIIDKQKRLAMQALMDEAQERGDYD